MKLRKIISWFVFLLVVGLATFWWAMGPEPMQEAKAYTVNDPALKDRVLIATQGSDFKDALVKEIVSELDNEPVFIRVIDISGLPSVKAEEWSAIVIIHSIEYWKPQREVGDFIRRCSNPAMLVVLSTSGEGTSTLEEIDGISSASTMSEVSPKAAQILRKVKALIDPNNLNLVKK